MRKARVVNKYGIKPKDIEKAIILKPELLTKEPFWRNNVIGAWCLSETTIKTMNDDLYGTYDDYWIGFYDDGRIELKCGCYGGMCHYNFSEFFNVEEIQYEMDLEIQEKLLKRINWLLDEEIVSISK